MACSSDELTVSNKQVCLVSYPKGWVKPDNFEVKEAKSCCFTLKPGSNDVLVKTLWLSIDPYLRLRMRESEGGLYHATFQIGKPLATVGLSRVIASHNPSFKVGDDVVGVVDIADYVLIPGGVGLQKVHVPGLPKTYHLGVLGSSGFTAWVGLNLIGKLKEGEEVYISAAAGSVGIVAGQLAKIKGCRVVGSAGSDEKVRVLKEEFGFDAAFNYKQEKDWEAALSKYCPNGIDLYFENVGGNMLEAVLQHVNKNGRIPVCGMVSQYNQEWTERRGVRNLLNMVGNCVKMEGFMITNHFETWFDFTEEMTSYIRQGKIKYKEHVFNGIDSFASAFIGLFNGENIGKVLIKLEDIEKDHEKT